MELSTRPRERKRKRLSEAFDSDEDSAFARAGDSLPAYVDIAPTDAAQLAAIAADPELIASIRQIPFALDSQILRYGAYKTRAGKFKCLTCSAHISANNLRKHMVVHFRADYSVEPAPQSAPMQHRPSALPARKKARELDGGRDSPASLDSTHRGSRLSGSSSLLQSATTVPSNLGLARMLAMSSARAPVFTQSPSGSEQFDEMMDAISTADSAASKRFQCPLSTCAVVAHGRTSFMEHIARHVVHAAKHGGAPRVRRHLSPATRKRVEMLSGRRTSASLHDNDSDSDYSSKPGPAVAKPEDADALTLLLCPL
eukprot:c17274_g1_i2.p1 GENE.c17274_g1_i2~~c17274_g1_i2.p1  ORF type:complete len:313 (+),score=50.16 c17274_g1_i2:225-1163(+)